MFFNPYKMILLHCTIYFTGEKMFSGQEQFVENAKTTMQAQIAAMNALAHQAIASVEKVVELNVTMAKQSFADNTTAVQQLLHAKGPQDFISLGNAAMRPNADKATAYGRQLSSITTAARSDFTQQAQSQLAEARRKFAEMMELTGRNAPAGTESMMAMAKEFFGKANTGFEQFSKTAQQAGEIVEVNVNNAVATMSGMTEKALSQMPDLQAAKS